MKLKEIIYSKNDREMILLKKEMVMKTEKIPGNRLVLKFINADSEELQGMEITFNGDRAIFKVGENETNHY